MDEKVAEAKDLKQRNSLLLIGCARGLLPDVEQLVEMGADPASKDAKGLDSMHFAAAHGQLEVVRFLWTKGVELDSEDADGRTPLHLAALRGHASVVDFLLEKGVWADAFDGRDDAPLHLAARHGQAVTTRALLDHNAKLKVVNKRGLTPLGEAVAAGHAECAAALVAAGADESHRPGGFSLLHVAAGVGREATLMWLLDRGADVNDAASAEGYTPLHSAALGGDAACVQALVEAGGKLDAVGADGATPAALVNQKAKGGKELLELLGGRDAARRPAGSTAAAATQPSASSRGTRDVDAVSGPAAGPAAAFAAMSEPDQLRRVRRWAEAPEHEFRQLLDGFQPEVQSRVADVRKLLQLITIHKAATAVHNDDDFQRDATDGKLQRVVDAVQANPNTYAKYAAAPATADALAKLQRFHTLVKANGGATVSIHQLLRKGDDKTTAEEDARVLRGLTGNLEATSRAARAAVLESEAGPEAAKAAAERAYKEYALAHHGSAPDAQSAPAAEPATSSAASAGSQAAVASQPLRPEGSGQPPGSGERPANSASSPATTAASATTAPTATTTKAGAADGVRRRRVGFEEISPADPPGTADGPPQGPDGVAGQELINVFSWKPWWDEIKKQWPKTLLQIVLPLLVMWILWVSGAGPFNKDFFPPSASPVDAASAPAVPAEQDFTEL